MVILGIILVLIALLLGAALLMGTSDPEVSGQDVDIQLFDAVTINLNPLTLVIIGMATMFLLWLGLVLIKTTLTRKAKQRKLRKQQAVEARERQAHEEQLREEERRATVGREQHGDPDLTRPVAGHGPADATRPVSTQDHGPADATRPIAREDAPADATRPIRSDEGTPGR